MVFVVCKKDGKRYFVQKKTECNKGTVWQGKKWLPFEYDGRDKFFNKNYCFESAEKKKFFVLSSKAYY